LGQRIEKRDTFIDLFAGCGGLSLGLMSAGWTGLFAVEKDQLAFETLKHNLMGGTGAFRYSWPEWLPQKHKTIGRFIKAHIKDLRKLRGQIDLICGGPPCQGFSFAGLRKRDDPRNALFRHYVAVVEAVQPKFLLLENVRGIDVDFGKKAKGGKRGPGRPSIPFSQKIKRTLEDLGYKVYPKLVRAAEFGVPQLRPRYIMVAIQGDIVPKHREFDPFWQLDVIRHNFLRLKGLSIDKSISVKQALSDLETRGRRLIECVDSSGFKQVAYTSPRTYYQRLLHGSMNGTAPNSLRLARHQDEIRKRFANILETCRRGVQLSTEDRERLGIKKHCTVPLDPSKPSHTLTTLPDDILHYSEPRILSVREYARLQSFPDWYAFKGKYTTGGDRRVRECPRYTQVGNAVPPFLAECLGRLLHTVAAELKKELSMSVPAAKLAGNRLEARCR
jgi:DNA (cytosine-5)-methyltransferase 1